MSDWAIRFNNVNKRFSRATSEQKSIVDMALGFLRRTPADPANDLWAVKEMTYEIKKGETVGFVGSNGSGKSTMLNSLCFGKHIMALRSTRGYGIAGR